MSPLIYPGRPEDDAFSHDAGEPDFAAVELDYWRRRLLGVLSVEREKRAVVAAFRALTAHAEPAPFAFDPQTRCMRNMGGRAHGQPLSTAGDWR